MSDEIFFSGVRYVSAAAAAADVDLTRDYIARLCKDGKISGRRVGKSWYVNPTSLKGFLLGQEHTRALRLKGLAEERSREYKTASHIPSLPYSSGDSYSSKLSTPAPIRAIASSASIPASAGDALREQMAKMVAEQSPRAASDLSRTTASSTGFAHAMLHTAHVPVHALAPFTEFLHKLIALTLAFTLTFGTYSLVDPNYARFAADSVESSFGKVATLLREGPALALQAPSQVALAAQDPGSALAAFSNAGQSLARLFNTKVNSLVYALAFPLPPSSSSVTLSVKPYARPVSLAVQQTTQSAARPTTLVTQPVIERTVQAERIVVQGGITQADLDAQLQALDNKLSSRIYALTSANSTAIVGAYNVAAQTNNIDQLYNVTLHNPTIIGGSLSGVSLSASDLVGLVGVAHGGTGLSTSPAYGQLLIGQSDGSYSLIATSSLGIGIGVSSPGGSAGEIQFNNYGTFGGSSAFTFATSTNTLTVSNLIATLATTTNATTTNLSATTASTTNLIVSSAGGTAGCATFSVTGLLSNTGVACGTGGGGAFSWTTGSFGSTVANSTSTLIGFTQGLYALASSTVLNLTTLTSTSTSATTTNLAVSSVPSAILTTNSSGSVIGSSTLAVNFGGTGSTTLSGLLTGNGTGAVTSASVSGPLSFSSNTLSITQANASTNGYLSSGDWSLFNGKVSSSSLASIFPFTVQSWGISTTSATGFYGGIIVNAASSTIAGNLLLTGNSTTTNATTTNLAVSSITNSLLSTNAQGSVVASTSIGTNLLTGPLGSINGTSLSVGGSITVSSTTLLANNNSWTGTNIFSGNVTLGSASTSNFAITNLASALLSVNANGTVIATSTIGNNQLQNSSVTINTSGGLTGGGSLSLGGTLNLTSFGWPFPSNATSTELTFNGGLVASRATTTNATSTTLFAGTASTTNFFGAGLFTCNSGNVLTWTGGLFGCASDQQGGGGSFPFTLAGYGVSTSTTVGFMNGILVNAASSTITGNLFITGNSTTTNATTTNLAISSLPNSLLTTNAQGSVVASSTLSASYGGTGKSSYAVGDILYADSLTTLARLAATSDGLVLKLSGGVPTWAADLTTGGSAGFFATTTDSLAIYPSIPSRVFLLGATATSTTGNIFEVLGNSLFRGALTAYNAITAPAFTATSTAFTSVFSGGLSVTGTTTLATATSSTFAITSLTNTLLSVNSSGSVIGTTTIGNNQLQNSSVTINTSGGLSGGGSLSLGGTLNLTSFSWPFPGNATTTGLGIYASTTIGNGTQGGGLTVNGGATTTNATSTTLAVTGVASTSALVVSNTFTLSNVSGILKSVAGVVTATLVDLASNVTGVLPVANGGTGWAAIAAGSIPYGNGGNALATTSVGTNGQVLALLGGLPTWTATTTFNAPLTYSAGAVSLAAANASTNGYLSSGDWTIFNNKISSTSLSATFPLAYSSATGAFTFGGLSTSTAAVVGNIPYFSSANTFANVATSSVTFSGPFNGLSTLGSLVGGSASTVTWTGLATTTQPSSSNLLVSNGGSGVYGVATTSVTCSGSTTCTGFTVLGASPITISSSGTSLGYVAWGGSLATTYGTTTIASTTPAWFQTALYASSTIGVPSIIDNFIAQNGTTTNATSSSFAITNLASALLSVNANGTVIATSTIGNNQLQNSSVTVNTSGGLTGGGSLSLGGTLNLSSFGWPFPSNATSTELTFNGGLVAARATTTNATSTTLAVTGVASTSALVVSNTFTLSNVSGILKSVAGVVTATLVDLASNVTGVLPVANGGTGWAAIAAGSIPYGNGGNALATTSVGTNGQVLALLGGLPTWTATTTFNAPLTYSAGAVSLAAANASTNGYLSSGDWTIFNGKVSSSSLASIFPFTVQSWGISTTSATGFFGGILVNAASSTIAGNLLITGNSTTTNATTTNLAISSLANTLLSVNASGSIIGTTTIGNNQLQNSSVTVNGTSISLGGSGTISTASSTLLANNNSWTGINIFTGNVTLGSASTSNFAITNLASALLSVNAQGSVIATTTIGNNQLQNSSVTINTSGGLTGGGSLSLGGTLNLSSFSWPFPGNATSTGLGIYASTTIGATTQATGLTISGGATTTADFVLAGSTNVALHNSSGALQVTSGAGSNSLSTLQAGSIESFGTGISLYSSFPSKAVALNTSGVSYFNFGNNFGIGTTTPQWLLNPFSSSAAQLALAAGTGISQWAFRNAGGNLYVATTTADGTATSTTAAFSIDGNGVVNFNALTLTSAAGSAGCATFSSAGVLSNTGVACGSGGGSFPFTATTFGSTAAVSTSTLVGFTQGLYALASSTVLNLTTLNSTTSNATTTGNAYFAGNIGIGTTTLNERLQIYNTSVTRFLIGDAARILQAGVDADVGAHYGLRGGKGISFADAGDLIPISIASNGATTFPDGNSALGRSTIRWASLFITGFNVSNSLVGIGTTTPGTLLSLGDTGANTINFSAIATSTFGSGINIRTGCFAINGTCVGSGSGSGTVNSGLAGQFPYYAADGTALTATSTLFLSTTGRIGIGTTTPWRQLSIKRTATEAQLAVSYDDTRYTNFKNDSVGDLYINSSGQDNFFDNDNLWVCTNGCPAGAPSGVGNLIVENKLGIGTTTPNALLTIEGQNSSDTLLRVATTTNQNILLVDNNGSVGVGTSSPTQQFSISKLLYVGANGTTGMGTATSTFQGDVKITGKLDVSTIDPVYTIDGTKYATYGHSTVGVKEEVLTTISLDTYDATSGKYQTTVAFDSLKEGSDLWLFYQVTEFGENWKDLVVSLTPSFDGSVFYTKDVQHNTLTISGTKAGEVSLRLAASRYDSAKWPNLRPDQEDDSYKGHEITSKLQGGVGRAAAAVMNAVQSLIGSQEQ